MREHTGPRTLRCRPARRRVTRRRTGPPNVVPAQLALTATLPPWFSATCLTIASPRPVPPVSRASAPGRRGRSARTPAAGPCVGIPTPSSVTRDDDAWPSSRRDRHRRPCRPAVRVADRVVDRGCGRAATGRARSRGTGAALVGDRQSRVTPGLPGRAPRAARPPRGPPRRVGPVRPGRCPSPVGRGRAGRSRCASSRIASRSSCAANRGTAARIVGRGVAERLGGRLDRGRRGLELVRGVRDEVPADRVDPARLRDVGDDHQDRPVVAGRGRRHPQPARGRSRSRPRRTDVLLVAARLRGSPAGPERLELVDRRPGACPRCRSSASFAKAGCRSPSKQQHALLHRARGSGPGRGDPPGCSVARVAGRRSSAVVGLERPPPPRAGAPADRDADHDRGEPRRTTISTLTGESRRRIAQRRSRRVRHPFIGRFSWRAPPARSARFTRTVHPEAFIFRHRREPPSPP